MAAPKRSKRVELQRWLLQHEAGPRTAVIGELKFATLRDALAPISENYLRKLLRDSGVPLAPLIAGVRQTTLADLESSLLALLDEYESGDQRTRTAVRRLVITAKDHARWAARSPERGAAKQEMILWMITWLENPPVFRQWCKLRRILN